VTFTEVLGEAPCSTLSLRDADDAVWRSELLALSAGGAFGSGASYRLAITVIAS
jgi:hypothetical protein